MILPSNECHRSDLTDGRQRQATSHYLSQCWPSSMSPCGVTRPQWVNPSGAEAVAFCENCGLISTIAVYAPAMDWLGMYWDMFLRVFYMINHYNDVIMGMIASQITSLMIVFSSVYLDTDQRKHQSSVLLSFVWGVHRRPVNSPHKWPITRKMFPFDEVIMSDWIRLTWASWFFMLTTIYDAMWHMAVLATGNCQ